ncbi:MAG: efflux RND transporter periplasmic adaptor subunit, partial [Gammaproteobacteria bacterium]
MKLQTLTETVNAYGQLVPAPGMLEWLSAAAGGRVSAVLVTTGTKVAAGQTLVKIAPTPQTFAAFKTAQGNDRAGEAKLQQTQTLFKNGLATRADLAAAEGQAASAQAAFNALTAAGVSAKGQILKARTAGVISQLAVTPGEWANAGARIAAVAPLGALWVRLGLTPEDAAKVRAGDAVQLTPVFGGVALQSQVARVNAQADATTGLIDAEVPVEAGASGPFAGEWVSGAITLRRVELPAVPRSAVLQDAQGY